MSAYEILYGKALFFVLIHCKELCFKRNNLPISAESAILPQVNVNNCSLNTLFMFSF